MKESTWRSIRMRALKRGITIAVYIEQLVQQDKPVQQVQQKESKQRIRRNAPESKPIKLRKKNNPVMRAARENLKELTYVREHYENDDCEKDMYGNHYS